MEITACIIAGIIACATLAAPLVKWTRLPTFFAVTMLGALAFVPSCIGIMNAVDAHRFGVFTYATFDDIGDFRVQQCLPPAATNITIDKTAYGFRAKYTITGPQLDAYVGELWEKYRDESAAEREDPSSMKAIDPESHKSSYGDLGWPLLQDAKEYRSPTARNGAGFSIWFSPSKGVAYQRTGYW
ncbi:MAG TPA: hypothetical protein VE890_18280 [Thermoguttaceae bacterium]|nr:hypothetical protein [Thermoguttaceae bacterium]